MPEKKSVNPSTGEIQSTPFNEFLIAQRGGSCLAELGEHLASIAEAVLDERRQGTLTLRLTLAPDDNDEDRIVIRDEIKAAPPLPPNKPSLFFRHSDGTISRRHEHQMSIEDESGLDDLPTTERED